MDDSGTRIARDHTKVNARVAWVWKMGIAIFVYVSAWRGADDIVNGEKLLAENLHSQSGFAAANGVHLLAEFTSHLARPPAFPECGFLIPARDEFSEKKCKQKERQEQEDLQRGRR